MRDIIDKLIVEPNTHISTVSVVVVVLSVVVVVVVVEGVEGSGSATKTDGRRVVVSRA